MKKSLKIVLIIIISFMSFIILDTGQAMFFNNSPLLKIRHNFANSYIDNGLLVNHYHCVSEEETLWKNVKYDCPLEEVKEISFAKTVDNLLIEMDIPSFWHYEELANQDDKLRVKIYKENDEQYVLLVLSQTMFGVCGTGLVTQDFKSDSNLEASIGYYDNKEEWDYVSFINVVPYLHFENHGFGKEDAEEFLTILKTLQIHQN